MQKMHSLFLTRAGPGELAVVTWPTYNCARATKQAPHICRGLKLTVTNAHVTDSPM